MAEALGESAKRHELAHLFDIILMAVFTPMQQSYRKD